MMKNMCKLKLVAGLSLMITLISPETNAFPLMCSDPSRLIASVKVTMQEVMVIKQEIDSNMRIIQEIQNGGFAAAGAMIFDKIQNGDYDRFGKALGNIKSEGINMVDNVKERETMKKREQELIEGGMDAKKAKAQAQQESAERLQKKQEERQKAAEEAKKNRGSNAFTSSYNWLKNNQSFTSGASSALKGVDSGNWGQVVSGATGATGSAVGNNTVGNIFTNAATGAGNAVNSAISGDWGNAFNSVAQGTGSAIGGATGSDGWQNTIGAIGSVGSGVYDSANSGGNFGQIVSEITNNGQVNSGIQNLGSGYEQINAEKEAAEKAQAEAARQWGEEQRKKNEELFAQQQKEKKCSDCIANAIKSGSNTIDAYSKCLSVCPNGQ